ncbi:RING finger domain-containing protein [Nannizzia gypsea CBS 118893]|uniref:RING finger domain-containing protein n=1 Tax=Arthroderma gypseum (strain ATCC MYA-4604 / CBS 118893) TaxID=535722 RepID=E4UW82_ARTGP|nr:RING finger domain-containing protein [Nannizzia gypsea CBS 118893]EFR01690.1 RING finger domain-containing protein [Nannizzia gypsea CBS 118893]
MAANNAKRRRSDDVDFSSNHPTASPAPSLPLPAISEKKNTDPSGLLATLQRHIDDIRSHIYCGVCIKPLYEPYTLPCGHTFCYSCLVQWFKSQGHSKTCPDCRAPVKSTPAPAYLVRNIVHMFIGRSELTDSNETTQEHLANQVAETEKVERDKKNTDPKTGGLFQGCFNRTTIPLYDNLEGVSRCPGCFWELEDGECTHCGYTVSDSDPDNDDDLDSIEQLQIMDALYEGHAADFHLHNPYPRLGYSFMGGFDHDESLGVESGEGEEDDEDEDDEDGESDLSEDESIESDEDSEISNSTARRASSDHGSQTIDVESTPSVQEIPSTAQSEADSEADSDEEPIRQPVRRRAARLHQSRRRTSFDQTARMTLPMFLLQASRRGNNPENAVVIDDSSPPRPAPRHRRH